MTSARMENLELDTGQHDRSVNIAPMTAIEQPKNAANAPGGAATRPIEAEKTLDAACADVRMYKIADDRRRQKSNWSSTGKSKLKKESPINEVFMKITVANLAGVLFPLLFAQLLHA
jgi:hypothetical protein